MRKITTSLLLTLLIPMAMMGADAKFFRKAADRVWNMRPDLFDPHREIPDSIKEGTSAVIIGEYNYLQGGYKAFEDTRGVETRSESETFTRRMVKLLDQKAVEEFSKHEFGESARIGARHRKSLAEADHAFGARIHKPDGTVTEVDLSKAYVIDEGKKGGRKKNSSRIIDIPGLEPGDVLEYFTYVKGMASEIDLPVQRVMLMADYPVLDFVVEGIFSPKLTVECRGYNGVPLMQTGTDKSGNNTVWLRGANLPVLTDKHFVNKTRELPFYDFYILNNTSPYRFYPKSMRGGGLYQNPLPGTIFRDISLGLAAAKYDTSTLPGKIRKIIKNYRKLHPDASPQELVDMAWTAANYANITDKEGTASDYWLTLIFCDILKKEKLAEDAGVAFINPATDVPTNEILNWRQPDFGALVDGKLYLVGSIESFLPGELPAEYQGQLCASYPGDRKQLWDFTTPTVITTPISKSGDNRIYINSVIDLGDDHDATVTNEIVCTGAAKDLSEGFISSEEWLGMQAASLGVEGAPKVILKNDKTEKQRQEKAEDLYSAIFIGTDSEISNVNVASFGITPELPDFRMTFDSKVKDISADAGDELIVRIGQFAGNNKRIEGKQRERMTDISFKAAYQENYSITLNIPDGYEVDNASLEALSKNVQTPAGMFYSGAKKSEDGRSVTVGVRSRIQHPLLSIAAWPHVLDLTDAQADFADAVIVLKKK
ncbi:MAG: DUF3857 domain-containing protein [Muribaculaceae bacterium]|nr:DUF3857 domain-containing protein [Muribaculaceae bacterium]